MQPPIGPIWAPTAHQAFCTSDVEYGASGKGAIAASTVEMPEAIAATTARAPRERFTDLRQDMTSSFRCDRIERSGQCLRTAAS